MDVAFAGQILPTWLANYLAGEIDGTLAPCPGAVVLFADPASATLYPAVDDEARSWRSPTSDEDLCKAFIRLGLPSRIMRQDVSTLSGGERQRLAFLPLVLGRPKLVIADECDGWLDDSGRELLGGLLRDVADGQGACMLIGTEPVIEPNRVYALSPQNGQLDDPGSHEQRRLPIASTAPEQPTVRCHGICFSVPAGSTRRAVLSDFSLEIRPGQWLGIAGPNGCGKSTVAHLLAGWIVPDAGLIEIANQTITAVPATQLPTLVGFVSQFPLRQLLCGSVSDEIALAASPELRERREKLVQSIDPRILQLPTRLLTPFQARVVLLACALSNSPRLVIIDEPTQGHDLTESKRLFHFLLENTSQEQAVIIVSHSASLLENFCHTVQQLTTERDKE
ncbi:MAG: ABC transporter ATP-binding protein [Phycisphaerae bacterium]|nr:MAG: ABC transporter ATP-binding protein [Phycisphaerae bacterium]